MAAALCGDHWRILVGDVFDGLASLADSSVHCCVTSPPYWGLRNYGFDGQIGSEKTPDEFVAVLVNVFREVRRVLRDDGVLFMNLGDSYSASKGQRKETDVAGAKQNSNEGSIQVGSRDVEGLCPTNKLGIPWRVALAMQADGWILRQDVIWSKPAPMPESVSGTRWMRCKVATKTERATDGYHAEAIPEKPHQSRDESGKNFATVDRTNCPGCDKCRENGGLVLRRGSWRPTTAHEYIFQFVKSQNYFCDGDGSKEEAVCVRLPGRKITDTRKTHGTGGGNSGINSLLSRYHSGNAPETRNMRSVWKLPPEGFKGAHFATYPTELVRRCLSAATSRGGCCSACGAQYAPVVESKRSATRPGTNSKVNRASDDGDSPYHQHSGDVVGNRDPQRHTTTTVVSGYLPTCQCNAAKSRPIVLDCFSGSGTTGQVAINMGCDYIGLEGNPDYAELQVKRLETPWVPVSERKKAPTRKKKRRLAETQPELF